MESELVETQVLILDGAIDCRSVQHKINLLLVVSRLAYCYLVRAKYAVGQNWPVLAYMIYGQCTCGFCGE